MSVKTCNVEISLPENIWETIEVFAKTNNMSVNEVVTTLLTSFAKDYQHVLETSSNTPMSLWRPEPWYLQRVTQEALSTTLSAEQVETLNELARQNETTTAGALEELINTETIRQQIDNPPPKPLSKIAALKGALYETLCGETDRKVEDNKVTVLLKHIDYNHYGSDNQN